jgi:ParB/RepB/Spo0J family partition protein
MKKVNINKIIIPQNRKRQLNPEKVKELKESIQEIGLLQPIIISSQNVLIAGLHRLEACKALGWNEIDCIIKDLGELDAELAEIDENLIRVELTVLERAELLKRRKEIYEAKYPETKASIGKELVNKRWHTTEKISVVSFAEDTAQKLGVTDRTIRHEIQIAKNIDDEVKSIIKTTPIADSKKDLLMLARLDSEKQKKVAEKISEISSKKLTIGDFRELVRKIRQGPPIPLPPGKYNIIYADPPWQYWEGGEKNQSKHYPTMTIEEIKNLPVQDLSADNCILFLWATSPMLPEAIEVMKAWGFSYSTVGFVWVKSLKDGTGFAFGLGQWTRTNAEYCLIGTKGHIERKDASIPQIVYAPREEHSKKPDIVRNLIVKLVGDLPRIELFARQKTEGWAVWGNEINE